ncbi:MAG: pyridoxamine 5'-phosphate oxidase [Chloroflexales bacterium]|nr:pyridoxamine 5'-phosphate oxidase [Chloroflexales bacterium]
MNLTIHQARKEYADSEFDETSVAPDPFQQFQLWFDAAAQNQIQEPNAMTLATVGVDGRPAARMVLLKDFDERGFVFYTNYESRKGQELARFPWAALVFWWGALDRQVRIEGQVERVAAEESDTYFQSRPAGSRLGAWTSPQSQVIDGRAILEQRLTELERQYADQPIPRPPHWGGYRLVPTLVEFWQGRLNRLHDRLCYRRNSDGNWQIERLAP